MDPLTNRDGTNRASMMRSVDYSLKSDLTRKLSYFGNLKTSIQTQSRMNNSTLNHSTTMNNTSLNDSMLVPILNNNGKKKKQKENLDNRIPSPIKNRLESIQMYAVDKVETHNKAMEHQHPAEDKPTKIVE